MNQGFWIWRDDVKRKVNLWTAVIFLFAIFGPDISALAAPQYFARPGAGVSRLPLDVVTFQAPGFGMLEDAINLANGNVFLSSDSVSRNNLINTTDENNTLFGANWNFTPRLRLSGFTRSLNNTVNAPATYSLCQGDGSCQIFTKITPTWTATPHWIQRYVGYNKTTYGTSFGVVVYGNNSQTGTQYSKEYIVLVVKPWNNTVAHYYDHSGTRYSFEYQGEFVERMQTLDQQYRGAQLATPQPEGEDPAPATKFWYTTYGSGRISAVLDEYGRKSYYEWNADNTLKAIYLGSTNAFTPTVPDYTQAKATATRMVEFGYATEAGTTVVSNIKYTTYDGTNQNFNLSTNTGVISRTYEFNYQAQNGRVLLWKIRRPVLGPTGWIETEYKYDATSNKVARVLQKTKVGSTNNNYEYPIAYRYSTSGSNAVVEVIQSSATSEINDVNVGDGVNDRHHTKYTFDPSGQLIKKEVWDYNPMVAGTSWLVTGGIPVSRWLKTIYTYNTTTAPGSTESITIPHPTDPLATGAITTYVYDTKGNLTSQKVFPAGANISTDTPERETTYAYDNDDLLTAQTKKGRTGGRNGGAGATVNYSYSDTGTTTAYTYTGVQPVTYSDLGTQTFKVLSTVAVSDVDNGVPYAITTKTYDPNGRLTQSKYDGANQVTITNYGYDNPNLANAGDGSETWQPFMADWMQSSRSMQQYNDLVKTQTVVDGANTVLQKQKRFYYDYVGDVSLEEWGTGVGSASGVYIKDYDNTNAPVFDALGTNRAFNGFGQKLWERKYNSQGVIHAESRWAYYSTGELDKSWEGYNTNLTVYAYYTSGANLGRVLTITKGIGNTTNGTIATSRSTQDFAYDLFGRVNSQSEDGYNSQITFDTLDRQVKVVDPGSGSKSKVYNTDGSVWATIDNAGNPRIDNFLATWNDIDSLGRVIATRMDHHAGTLSDYSLGQVGSGIYYTYDPFDRPIKIRDDRLDGNNPGDSRETYMVYDSRGNLRKKQGAQMRSAGSAGYVDSRRSFVEYYYDNRGRKTEERKLLSGSVTITTNGTSDIPPASYEVAQTFYSYDALDHVIQTTDPDGYIATLGYDEAGNVITKTQQVWKGTETDYATLNSGFTSITTRIAYDGAGRPLKVIDPAGKIQRKSYDLIGNITSESETRTVGGTEKDVVYNVNTYTGDGLLDSVYEPDNNNATQTSGDLGQAGYIKTKRYVYGSRRFPTQMCSANMDTSADSSSFCTYYYYDYAGRTVETTLPGGTFGGTGSIGQQYDSRGNQKYLRDAEGFITEFSHDGFGRIVEQVKRLRVGNTNDSAAFPNGDQYEIYRYDNVGNLIRKYTGPIGHAGTNITDFYYNSLGKVQLENRPHRSVEATPTYKLRAYRLDGELTGESTYNIVVNGDANNTWALNLTHSNMPTSYAAGNLTAYSLSKAGLRTSEQSYGTVGWVYSADFVYNGLGSKSRRYFNGNINIYQKRRDNNGYLLGNGIFTTYWKFSAIGKLTNYWEKVSNNDVQNQYTYTYSPSGKEVYATHDVRFKARSYFDINPNTSDDLKGGLLMGATIGNTTTAYTERDQVASISFSDTAPTLWTSTGKTINKSSTYTYYLDGNKKRLTNSDGAYSENTYDSRGRVTNVYDSNGSNKTYANLTTSAILGPINVSTTYSNDGTKVDSVSNQNLTGCVYKQRTIPTIGGLIYRTETWDAGGTSSGTANCSASANITNTNTYGVRNQITNNSQYVRKSDGTYSTQDIANYVDTYGLPIESDLTIHNYNASGIDIGSPPMFVSRNTLYASGTDAPLSIVERYPDYNGNGSWAGSYTTRSITYILDSRGNRTSVVDVYANTTTPWPGGNDQRSKRYDAEGRAAEFDIEQSTAGVILGIPAGHSNWFATFHFDPFGNQVLSETGSIWAEDGGGTPQWQHAVNRESYTNIIVGNEIHFTRKQKGSTANWWHPAGYYSCGWQFECVRDWDNNQEWWQSGGGSNTYKDAAYSLVDGIMEGNWSIIAPYNVRPRAKTNALAAPVTPFSIRTRLTPGDLGVMDIKPPTTAKTPDVGTVKPPSTASQNTAGNQAGSFGINSQSLPSLVVLPGVTANQTSSAAKDGFSVALSAPSSVLPTALQGLAATDLSAPSPTPPTTPDPNKVTNPTQPTPPTTGTSPHDVAPPANGSVIPPTIAPIGNVTPGQIQVNQADVQTQDVGVLNTDNDPGVCSVPSCATPPKNPGGAGKKKEKEQEKTTGGNADPTDKDVKAAVDKLTEIANDPTGSIAGTPAQKDLLKALSFVTDDTFKGLWPSPKEKIEYLVNLGVIVADPTTRSSNLNKIARRVDNLSKSIKGGSAIDTANDARSIRENVATFTQSIDPNMNTKIAVFIFLGVTAFTPIGLPEDVALGILVGKTVASVAARIGGRLAARFGLAASEGIEKSLARIFGCDNSFAPNTRVATLTGLVAIAALSIGTPVLAYNEQTGKNEYQPITDIFTHGEKNQKITYLAVLDDDYSARSNLPTAQETLFASSPKLHTDTQATDGIDWITATAGHPFYLAKNVDHSPRPAVTEYGNLDKNWVGAGDLKVGDKIRQANGRLGTVVMLKTEVETRTMYNLTVDNAHTFYVGDGQWLVHNCGISAKLQDDGFFVAKNDSGAWIRFRQNSDGSVTVTDVYKGNGGSGQGGILLADALRDAGIKSPTRIDIITIADKPVAAGARSSEQVFRDLVGKTVDSLGGSVKSIDSWKVTTGSKAGTYTVSVGVRYP